ncbi:MAG TPA: flagellar export chaperone FliS [Eubacteriaceae bacterium]|nr:flagellar export chaperone FliS [Eubacteriaceae bacterium]
MQTSNAYANAGNAYKNNEVMTASSKKLVILLYEGVVKNLKLAKIYIEEQNIQKTNAVVGKAQDIIAELMSTLNFDEGGEIAGNLYALYEYMYRKTISANINKSSQELDEVIGYFEELKETWMQI